MVGKPEPVKRRHVADGPPVANDGAASPTSPDKVVAAIYSGILSGNIVPGQKLIEADLAQMLKVSRGPIREAFKRLHAEGVVESTRNRGAYVRSLSRREALDFLEIVAVLTDLMAVKAAAAIHAADADWLSLHKSSIAALEHYANMAEDGQVEGSWHFYDALMVLGGNTQIASVVPAMRLQLFRAQSSLGLDREAQRQRAAEYARIAQVVLKGDPLGAQLAMRIHMRNTEERLGLLPDTAFANR